ncbi:MAG: response regulator [Phycisphaeraceae bacterium]|nr:response regulator [Phycisphaerae bacterium]MBX3392942.1 response regulator [Phycisphaeraceae bacterium]
MSAPSDQSSTDVPSAEPPPGRFDPHLALRLFETIGEGVCVTDPQGRVLWSNSVFQEIDPATRSRLFALARAVAPPGPDPRAGERGLLTPEPTQTRSEVASADNARTYEVTVRAIPAEDRCVLVTRDVTDQVRARREIEAIEIAGDELVRMDAELLRKLNAVERLRHLESKIVNAARQLLHFDHFVIRLLDNRSGRLEPVIVHGLPTSIADIDIYPLAEGNGISGYVAATGQSYICPDTAADDLFLPGLGGARSSLTIPLRLQDRILGIINVESQNDNAFTENDRRLGEILARYIALAFHMLDLLVVERSTVNQSVTVRLEDDMGEPLEDILSEVTALESGLSSDPQARDHVARIKADVNTIRERVRDLAAGPNTLLGAGVALGPAPHDPAFAGKRVLVADDHARIRRIIGDVLRHRGCEVHLEESGVKAIATLEAVRAGSLRPFDLVISDIQMPDRNGYEVFNASKSIQPDVPVILMTGFGYDPHHSIVRASQEGLQAVLFKPFPVDRMLEEVRKAVAERP